MDWFVALAPLLALILILIFGFTGCGIDTGGRASPVHVNTLFFPTDDPAAPTQLVSVILVPRDAGDHTSGDFPPMPGIPEMGPDGSRSQRIAFASAAIGQGWSVLSSRIQRGLSKELVSPFRRFRTTRKPW